MKELIKLLGTLDLLKLSTSEKNQLLNSMATREESNEFRFEFKDNSGESFTYLYPMKKNNEPQPLYDILSEKILRNYLEYLYDKKDILFYNCNFEVIVDIYSFDRTYCILQYREIYEENLLVNYYTIIEIYEKNGNFYLKVYNPFITGLMDKEICRLINSPHIDHQEVPFQSVYPIDASQTQIVEENLIILFHNLDYFIKRLTRIKFDAFEFVVGNFLDGFIDSINNIPKKLKYFDINIQVLLTINIFSIFKFKKFKYYEEMENVYFSVDRKDCTSNFIEIMLQDIDFNVYRL